MSYLEPLAPVGQLSPVPLPGLTPDTNTPIIQNLPESRASFERKYNDPDTIKALKRVPKNVRRSVIELDKQRVLKGQYPMSVEQTANALITAVRHKPVTEKKKSSPFNPLELLNNARKDVQSIVTEVPKLPITLVNEAGQMMNMGEHVAKADTLGDYAQLPGVRLIPGSYVASGLLPGGVPAGELVRHPVFTALDVLPYGQKLLATEAGIAAKAKVADSAVGRAVGEGADALAATRGGQYARRMWSKTERANARLINNASLELGEQVSPLVEKPGPLKNVTTPAAKTDDALATATREAQTYERDMGITPERAAELKVIMEQGDLTPVTSPNELAYIAKTRELGDTILSEGIKDANLRGDPNTPGVFQGEVYDAQSLRKLRRSEAAVKATRTEADIINRATEPIEDFTGLGEQAARDFGPTANPDLSRVRRARLAEGYAHTLDAAGQDAAAVYQAVKDFRAKKITDAELTDITREALDNPTARANPPHMTQQEVLDAIPDIKTDPQLVKLRDAVKNGRYGDAAKLARGLGKRTKSTIPGIEDSLDNLVRARDRQTYINRAGKVGKKAEALERRHARLQSKTTPGRFVPRAVTEARKAYAIKLSDGTPDNIAAIDRQLVTRDFDNIPGFNEIEFSQLTKEHLQSWQDMKAQGLDPVFVHSYNPGQKSALAYPKITGRVSTPSSFKARSQDWTPNADSASVGHSLQGLEYLKRRGDQGVLDSLVDQGGTTYAELDAKYRPIAERRAHTPEEVPKILDKLMKKEWEPFDASEFGATRGKRISDKFGDEQVWMPKTTMDNLRMYSKVDKGAITAVLDPVMGVFRTAVLPLSPRWQVYNLLGGFMMVAAQDPRALLKIPSAWKAVKNGGEGLAPELRRMQGSSLRPIMEDNAAASQRLFQHRAGRTMGRLLDETNAARQVGKVGSKAREMFGKTVKWSFDRNAFVDDLYRSAAYLSEFDAGIKKGLTREAAEQAGMEMARKTLQTWTEITPLERSIMRYAFPFYGFMQHIMRYAFRYPIEHPFRTAVLGSFARAEEEDFGTGLPQRFLNGFFLGEPDENGNVTQINLDGLNPFRDVANNFTLAGLAGQANPLVSTALEQLGVDAMSGGPELFPTLRYDSETGRLGVASPNPAMNLLGNTIPQFELLRSLMGTSGEFKELMRTNPDAAARLLRSQAGLPIMTKTVNVPQEEIKNQIALEENQQKVLSDALKSGDYTEAMQYPALKPYLGQVQKLSKQGKLKQYQPVQGTPSGLALAGSLVPR